MQVEIFMVVGYVLMSSAIGTFAASACAQLALREEGPVRPFVRTSYLASCALMVMGAACTLLHLGNIGYFYGILSNFGSWLTRESWMVGLFSALCVVAAVLAVRNARKPLAIVGVLGMVAGALLLFCMSMAYMSAHAIASWSDLGVMVTNLAEMFVLGAALALLIVSLTDKGDNAAVLLKKSARAGLSLPLVVAFVALVLASDVISRVLHFALATHAPLVF